MTVLAWDSKRKRDERAADKAELEEIRAGHDKCLCAHRRREHHKCAVPGCTAQYCGHAACGCNVFRPDPRYAR